MWTGVTPLIQYSEQPQFIHYTIIIYKSEMWELNGITADNV